MPKYTGDKFGFGVAPVEAGDGAPEVGYSTSFDNLSHTKRTEHKWIVPKTARYNFEVWGADGGMGIAANGDNNNGGIPRYGRGGKVECSMQLTAGTEIGIMIGDNGLPCFSFSGTDTGTFLNDGEGGYGGGSIGQDKASGVSLASGGNSNYNKLQYGGATYSGNSYSRQYRGGGGGGGTIVRLFESTQNAGFLIVAGGGGGAGARGDDHGNSHNQGGAGGNSNDKINETRWGMRGHFSGDTSYGWPSGNVTGSAQWGTSSGGGGGNVGYYAGGAGGGGGEGGGGAGATCSYCGTSAGGGGGPGNSGNKGNNGYDRSTGGSAQSSDGSVTVVGSGGNSDPGGKGRAGAGGGGYRGGGAGYWGNGTGHAGSGGGGGGSSWVTSLATYEPKGLNGLTNSPRYTSEQKPMRLGNPGGGKVLIWEANKDPLGKNRVPELTADKIQYLVRSSNGGASNNSRLFYLGSANTSEAQDGGGSGGGNDYSVYNNYPYQTPSNTCDALVMNISGVGTWELHSVTVGQCQGYDYPRPYRHQCWVHVIEGTETGGVGIHTEKFDSNNVTGNPGVAGWYAHKRASSKTQNTDDGYIELFFEKPAVLTRGENYTIALDWSCGGTNPTDNNGGMACMNTGAKQTLDLAPSTKGTATWSNVTAYNGPHGLGTKNSNNGMETSSTQGLMVHMGVRSYTTP